MLRFTIPLVLVIANFSAAAEDGELVWFWFADCGSRMMKLEVRLDQKVVFESTFHVCHALRSSSRSQSQRTRRLDFRFKSPRAIVWQGYKNEDELTPPGKQIEGSIWQAGADPDCMILGVGFGGRNANYMNTLHIAYPNRRQQWVVAPGLVTVTYPVAETVGKSQWMSPSKMQQRTY